MNELVSIIVPIYNSEKYLKKCLDSIISQSYSNIEIIIVDSGAIDNSRALAEEIAANDSRFIFVEATSPGPADARMAGFNISKGKYITFIDSDDYIEVDFIKKFVYTAEANKSDLVICGYVWERPDGSPVREVIPTSYIKNVNEIWPYRICSTWGRFYRKELWLKHNVCFLHENDAIGEDMPVSFLTNTVSKNISVVPSAEYHYVRHNNSIMGRMSKEGNYRFPYDGLKKIHKQIMNSKIENSEDFYYIGLLKFFSKFEFDAYSNVPSKEKKRYRKYVAEFTGGEIDKYILAWHNLHKKLELSKRTKYAMFVMLVRLKIWKILG